MPQSTSLIPHAFSEILPAMADSDLASLRESLKTDGYIGPPIYTFEGKILDGVHRYRLCMELGIDPQFVEYAGADAFRFALNQNLARRHLNESQRAMVAARLVTTEQGRGAGGVTVDTQICVSTQPESAAALKVSQKASNVPRRCSPPRIQTRLRRWTRATSGCRRPSTRSIRRRRRKNTDAFGIHRQRYQRMPHGRSS